MSDKHPTANKPDYQHPAEQATASSKAMNAVAVSSFHDLGIMDPELAGFTMEVHGTEQNAAGYFMRRQRDFQHDSVCAALEAGERERVMVVLRGVPRGIVM